MASKLDQLRPASFRGLSFLTPSDDKQFGKRVITHEFPGKEDPTHEDMGGSPKEFTITAIIAGEDFLAVAEAFDAALDKGGAGTLVHPYYGSLNVIVMHPIQRSHSMDAVGEVRYSITFQKYAAPVYPKALSSTISGLSSAADDLFGSIETEFKSHFNIDGLQDFLIEDAAGQIAALSSTVTGLMSKGGLLSAAMKFVPPSWNVTSNIAGQVIDMFKNIAGLVKPSQKVVMGSTKVSTSTTSARDVLNVMTAATTVSNGETTGRASRVRNAEAIEYLFRASALAAAASVSRYATYTSKEDALAVRNNLASNVEQLTYDLGEAGYDKSWRDSKNVLAALTKDINERLGRLPKTYKVKPAALMSSLALSHRLYGDDPANLFKNAADMVTRNKIRHPGIVPVSPLEVLLND